jgi:hypothetical protein
MDFIFDDGAADAIMDDDDDEALPLADGSSVRTDPGPNSFLLSASVVISNGCCGARDGLFIRLIPFLTILVAPILVFVIGIVADRGFNPACESMLRWRDQMFTDVVVPALLSLFPKGNLSIVCEREKILSLEMSFVLPSVPKVEGEGVLGGVITEYGDQTLFRSKALSSSISCRIDSSVVERN